MIQPTSNFHGYTRSDAVSGPGAKPVSGPKTNQAAEEAESENFSSANTQALREALSRTPEIRPEVVERGKRLAVDPNYPPREIIDRLADLMTRVREPNAE
ncbi:MAG: hypothetical protein SFV32_03835 [Opitutaceae bacterium]|nr:hypothetical protein [Opitutaceae bacterium]